MSKQKKIAICHYRVGGTDGVSLEIEKRKKILEKHGCEVKLIAGKRSEGADYTIEQLEWDDGIVPVIKENGFQYFQKTDLTDQELKDKISEVAAVIKNWLDQIQLKEKFDAILVHNIFSFGGHIAAAKAFYKWIEKHKLMTIATHHDFYWEREAYLSPRSLHLQNYLRKFMPPKSSFIKHVVINSLAKNQLAERSGIRAFVLPDVFDFRQKKWRKDSFNKDFYKNLKIKPDDLVFVQATRIVPRKAIEVALDFAKIIDDKIKKLRGKKIYNGKKLGSRARVVFVTTGYVEDENRMYLAKLRLKARKLGLNLKIIFQCIGAKRNSNGKNCKKKYSIWDAYVFADLVTYPSVWEGWGNQFIESVFARKPIVVFEYPVFKTDIKPEGYHYISLGSRTRGKDKRDLYMLPKESLDKAVDQTIKCLLDKNLNKKLEENFKIGKKFHDDRILEKFLVKQLKLG